MHKVQGIVFDVDGTLFDTASLIFDAYRHLAELYGYEAVTREQIAEQMGRPIPEIIANLFPGADVSAMLAANSDFVMKRAAQVIAYDGLEATLRKLHEQGIVLGILTSGGEKVHGIIGNHKLDNYFKSVVYADRVKNHKPHPEGFALAISEMGVAAKNTVMVGDMQPDIDVATNAGALASVGVTHGFSTREHLETYGADYVIDTLAELLEVVEKLERT